MRKILFFLLLSVATQAAVKDTIAKYHFSRYAILDDDDDCDACGCSASGGSMGFASMLNTNFVGVRYLNQQYKSSDGLYSNSAWYTENFNTLQLWARIPVLKNIQVSVLVPYHFHSRDTKTGNQRLEGFGDVTVLAMYRVYQTHRDSTIVTHTLQLGGGIKAPTGKFNETNSGSLNPSFQAGTGSWDYLLASEYILRRKQFGLNTTLNYIMKYENERAYRFGNQFNYAATLFYLHEKNSFSMAPQIGLAGEVYASNFQHGQELVNTSGDILFSKIGVEMGKDKWSFGVNTMLPIRQNLAGGNVQSQYRLAVNLNYSL
ncbi:transporter [Flavobacterium sp. CYK-4]|uniref:transporter n=1 Tax=Flavobacterium lotistagni TaxID=2709660 RepID=UPI001409685C|nr:transporter [Flavobacterium lotistagni]NHM05623.1 transporter [Flavobacterium lotistagni]